MHEIAYPSSFIDLFHQLDLAGPPGFVEPGHAVEELQGSDPSFHLVGCHDHFRDLVVVARAACSVGFIVLAPFFVLSP